MTRAPPGPVPGPPTSTMRPLSTTTVRLEDTVPDSGLSRRPALRTIRSARAGSGAKAMMAFAASAAIRRMSPYTPSTTVNPALPDSGEEAHPRRSPRAARARLGRRSRRRPARGPPSRRAAPPSAAHPTRRPPRPGSCGRPPREARTAPRRRRCRMPARARLPREQGGGGTAGAHAERTEDREKAIREPELEADLHADLRRADQRRQQVVVRRLDGPHDALAERRGGGRARDRRTR